MTTGRGKSFPRSRGLFTSKQDLVRDLTLILRLEGEKCYLADCGNCAFDFSHESATEWYAHWQWWRNLPSAIWPARQGRLLPTAFETHRAIAELRESALSRDEYLASQALVNLGTVFLEAAFSSWPIGAVAATKTRLYDVLKTHSINIYPVRQQDRIKKYTDAIFHPLWRKSIHSQHFEDTAITFEDFSIGVDALIRLWLLQRSRQDAPRGAQ